MLLNTDLQQKCAALSTATSCIPKRGEKEIVEDAVIQGGNVVTDIAQVWQSETQIGIIYATKSSRSNKSADRSKDSSAIFRHYINVRLRQKGRDYLTNTRLAPCASHPHPKTVWSSGVQSSLVVLHPSQVLSVGGRSTPSVRQLLCSMPL